jgi:RNase P subunit RPR2
MRTPVNVKKGIEMKAPLKEKVGPLIMLPIKKIYCTKCKILVKGRIQSSGSVVQVTCPKCIQNLRVWASTSWRSVNNQENASQ